jgi:hypothetical protein
MARCRASAACRPAARAGPAQRRAPQHHQAVADELVDGAAEGRDDAGGDVEKARELLRQLLGGHGLGDLGEAAHVDEHDGEHARLAAGAQGVALRHQLVDDVDRRELHEGLQAARRLVQRLVEVLDLEQAAVHARQVAHLQLADAPGVARQPLDGLGDAARHAPGHDQHQGQEEQRRPEAPEHAVAQPAQHLALGHPAQQRPAGGRHGAGLHQVALALDAGVEAPALERRVPQLLHQGAQHAALGRRQQRGMPTWSLRASTMPLALSSALSP